MPPRSNPQRRNSPARLLLPPMHQKIGFMQGRLSPLVEGKIQAFPCDHWRDEFPEAQNIGVGLMEWTLDHERLRDNPLLTREGRNEIRRLSAAYEVRIDSVTGDCFMQAPFYKANSAARRELLADFEAVVAACADLGITRLVVPLVDDGTLETASQERMLTDELVQRRQLLHRARLAVVFESDFCPARLQDFITSFPAEQFGINYDIGNSAALGYDPSEEIGVYGARILNVHVKDRLHGGTSVALGTGNADLPRVFRLLRAANYQGNYILQTARVADGRHAGALRRYLDMVEGWIEAG